MRSEICEDCRRLTAGSCWRHQPGVADVVAVQSPTAVTLWDHRAHLNRIEAKLDRLLAALIDGRDAP